MYAAYLFSSEERFAATGGDVAHLVVQLFNPSFILTAISIVILVVILAWILPRNQFVISRIRHLRGRARTYTESLPLFIRLSVAFVLIMSSANQMFLTPTVVTTPWLTVTEGIIGVLLVVGLLSIPAMVFAAIIFIAILISNGALLSHLEFLGLALAWLCLGSTRPGLDDLLKLPEIRDANRYAGLAPLILRLGLGLGLVFSLGPIELILGVFILFGVHTRLASLFGLLMLTINFLFINETADAHVSLFGALTVLFILGNGPHTLKSWYARRFA